ncbi:hypothetical protein QJQ45_019971 [Haematococcus lacustris]|nr:hypothetical protein QJQ45_019971 [Haematococcus lacustris]
MVCSSLHQMYDDLAASPYNPLPGRIINRPGAAASQARRHQAIDWLEAAAPHSLSTRSLRAACLHAVACMQFACMQIACMQILVVGTDGVGGGSGEVISSGPMDRVFVFYSDHGSPGVLGMPTGQDPGPAEGFDTCLGDLYSVAVMEDCDTEDLALETLQAQFQLVSARTSNNFTYVMGSHAQQYGTLRIEGERAGSYLGMRQQSTRSPATTPGPSSSSPLSWRHLLRGLLQPAQQQPGRHRQRQGQGQVAHHAVLQRDADLEPLRARAAWAPPGAVKEAAEAKLRAALQQRAAVDNSLAAATQHLLGLAGAEEKLLLHLGLTGAVEVAAALAVGRLPLQVDALARELQYGHMGRPNPHQPLVDSWDCLRGMVRAYEVRCGRMDQYSMRHTRLFANLCNAGLQPAQLGAGLAAVSACSVQMAAVQ